VHGVTLYRRLVQSRLERDSGKHQLRPYHKERLMAERAATLLRGRRRLFDVTDLENSLLRWLAGRPALEWRYQELHPHNREEDLRTATFLVRQDQPDAAGFRSVFAIPSVPTKTTQLTGCARKTEESAPSSRIPGRERLISAAAA